jgi:ATP-dependent DNA helicase RecG
LSGSTKISDKRQAKSLIESGKAMIVIGTQAVIEHDVHFPNLGLVVIDEQHRFGVEQRKKLQAKDSGLIPHLLSMTATPIPRTLALTLYGELDVSVIDELPPGRLPVETIVMTPNHRAQMNQRLAEEVSAGRQGYVICPLIDDSEMLAAKSATSEFERLKKSKELKHIRFGLLHGQLKSVEKAEILAKFYAHEIDVIISTTVVEVGVSVANATIMIIEGAERFGLAQLHQLRGRVGRSTYQSYCFAMTTQDGPKSQRLRAFESTSDGFKLAELDMEIRGPGAIYGTMQSGALDLKIANLADTRQIARARQMAKDLVDTDFTLSDYPILMEVTASVRKVVSLN